MPASFQGLNTHSDHKEPPWAEASKGIGCSPGCGWKAGPTHISGSESRSEIHPFWCHLTLWPVRGTETFPGPRQKSQTDFQFKETQVQLSWKALSLTPGSGWYTPCCTWTTSVGWDCTGAGGTWCMGACPRAHSHFPSHHAGCQSCRRAQSTRTLRRLAWNRKPQFLQGENSPPRATFVQNACVYQVGLWGGEGYFEHVLASNMQPWEPCSQFQNFSLARSSQFGFLGVWSQEGKPCLKQSSSSCFSNHSSKPPNLHSPFSSSFEEEHERVSLWETLSKTTSCEWLDFFRVLSWEFSSIWDIRETSQPSD